MNSVNTSSLMLDFGAADSNEFTRFIITFRSFRSTVVSILIHNTTIAERRLREIFDQMSLVFHFVD